MQLNGQKKCWKVAQVSVKLQKSFHILVFWLKLPRLVPTNTAERDLLNSCVF